jgi:hypothetical protein
MSQYHADKITRVAAQLAAERFGGWSNPLVVDLVSASTFLLGGDGGSLPGPHGAVLSTDSTKEGSSE